MLTNTHILIAATALSRPRQKGWLIAAAWLGGFFPDFSVFVMVAVARLTGLGGGNLWRQPDGLYWQEPWQFLSAVSNSMPLWAAMALFAWQAGARMERMKPVASVAMLFALGCLLHVLLDFPVHTDDAHVHFWPFTDWRFHSAVSYYQRDHFGGIVGAVEMIAGLAMAAFLVVRFRQWSVRILAVLMAVPYFLSLGLLMFWHP
jgi:hypothetical protein